MTPACGPGGATRVRAEGPWYADACNLFARDPSEVAHKLEVLARHCDTAGRDPAGVEKTILVVGGNPLDDLDAFIATMHEYAQLGVELVEIVPRGPDPVAIVTQLGEQVVPKLAALSAL